MWRPVGPLVGQSHGKYAAGLRGGRCRENVAREPLRGAQLLESFVVAAGLGAVAERGISRRQHFVPQEARRQARHVVPCVCRDLPGVFELDAVRRADRLLDMPGR